MSWKKLDSKLQTYCQDDIIVYIIKTGHVHEGTFHVIYEDAYGDTGHSLMTLQEIKDQYGIEIEVENINSENLQIVFSAEVYYDDGLAKKIQPLPQVTATNPEYAQLLAEEEANKLVGEEKMVGSKC